MERSRLQLKQRRAKKRLENSEQDFNQHVEYIRLENQFLELGHQMFYIEKEKPEPQLDLAQKVAQLIGEASPRILNWNWNWKFD